MSEQKDIKANKKKEIIPANLGFILKTFLILAAAVGTYFLIATHFLFCVRTAHFLGDVTYIPPSILYYTGVIFREGEVEAGIQILYFVCWLIFVLVSCALIFTAAFIPVTTIMSFFTSDERVEAAILDCMSSGLICLVPVLALSLLTLLIMPLESTHLSSDSASLTQIGALMPFYEFLFTSTEATVIIFLVCFFVVLTCAAAFLLSFILPDNEFFFFVSMFLGVCIGIAVIFILGHYIFQGIEFIKFKTENAYLTHYAIFGIYAVLCIAFILPSFLKSRSKTERKEKIAQKKIKYQTEIAANQ